MTQEVQIDSRLIDEIDITLDERASAVSIERSIAEANIAPFLADRVCLSVIIDKLLKNC